MAQRRWQRRKECAVCRKAKFLRNFRFIGHGRGGGLNNWAEVCLKCEQQQEQKHEAGTD
ncbi:hypothetical protein [Conchiformibius steedae]|uniref:hypothetical protein n=1 Tax=Conchiformibius steedae TaxID=153493 RepID=UPI001639E2AC|nr:hypothetical protein [Conchiformibius steedae]